MNFKMQLCLVLVALVQLARSDDSLDERLIAMVDSFFPPPDDSIALLSFPKSFENSGKLSLTKGGSTAGSYKIHQDASQVLAAHRKLLRANLTELTYNKVISRYHVPKWYCPEKDYDYYGCNAKDKYRTIDGTCNNLYVPWWGKSETPYSRILNPDYDDRYNSPRKRSKIQGKLLPNPRNVAMNIHFARRTMPETTHMLVFFGQHIDHDIVFTSRSSYSSGQEKKCSCESRDPDCFQIPIPSGDYYNQDQRCFPFTRSSASIENFKCKFSYREQLNLATSFLDMSNIYGPTEKIARSLREHKHGLLKMSVNPVNGHSDLPLRGRKDCSHIALMESCYKTGDSRSEDNTYLISLHRLSVNQHNKIAKKLYQLNPHWSDEHLYQEARKINIGQYQHVVYYEYLPMLLGSHAMKKWDLIPSKSSYFNGYNKKLNPNVKNSFATAAGRYGHTLINKFHYSYDKDYNLRYNTTTNNILFKHTYNGFDDIRGSLMQNSYYMTPAINDYLNNYLFQYMTPDFKRSSLGALNIQRGRDHGIPDYNQFRGWCGLKVVNSFEELTEMPTSVRYELKKLYASVNDIDLFTGIMSEYAVQDGVVGPTTACILADGFHDWKYGDRFYYENNDKLTGFSPSQLREIKKTTMASLICDNTDIYFVQRYPFLEANPDTNPLVDCSKLKRTDLRAF